MFGPFGHQHVALTEESMKLPFEEQPWFMGAVGKGELKLIEQGTQTRTRSTKPITKRRDLTPFNYPSYCNHLGSYSRANNPYSVIITLAQTRMFFTRAKGPKVYLHWTTTKRLKNPERPILLTSHDISTIVPNGEFVTAMYNGGKVQSRNEFLLCQRVVANDLIGAKRIMQEKGR